MSKFLNEVKTIINGTIVKHFIYILLLCIQLVLFVFNISGISREVNEFWYEFFIEWLLLNRYAYITVAAIIVMWLVVFLLSQNRCVTFFIMEIVTMIFGYANKVKYIYTGQYISLNDINLVDEAENVVINIWSPISDFVICLVIAGIVAGLVIYFLSKYYFKPVKSFKARYRIVLVIVIVMFSALFYRSYALENKYLYSFGFVSEEELGAMVICVDSIYNYNQSMVGEDELQKYIDESYISNGDSSKNSEKPNIIAIMSESFWDTDYLLDTVEYSNDPLMYWKELCKESISGEIAVNIYGAKTVTTEFEFLTGINAINLLDVKKLYYEDYVYKEQDSLVSYLSEMGYNSVAFHPGEKDFFGREMAYENFGFSQFFDMTDFTNPQFYRGYISDLSLTDEIIYRYEKLKEKSDAPVFAMSVSIANHVTLLDCVKGVSENKEDTYSDLIDVNIKKDVDEETRKSLVQYVNGVKMSMDALEELVEYYRNSDDKTVIVFFGDHAPSFAKNVYSGKDMSCLYRTPYIIWANYELETKDYGTFNSSYLSSVLLDYIGSPECARTAVNKRFMNEYPIDTKYEKKDSEGNTDFLKKHDEEMESYFNSSLIMQSIAKRQLNIEGEDINMWKIH